MDYIKSNISEPIVHIRKEHVTERIIEKSDQPIDVNALASAIAQVLKTMPNVNFGPIQNKLDDGFDSTKTLEKLAQSMTVQRGNNESNFTDLGNEYQTKINKEEVNKTIDLLSGLDD